MGEKQEYIALEQKSREGVGTQHLLIELEEKSLKLFGHVKRMERTMILRRKF